MKSIQSVLIHTAIILFLQLIVHFELNAQTLVKKSTLNNHDYWCSDASGTRFGNQIVMGDLNNDGYDDVVVYASKTKLISVYFGFVTGTVSLESEIDYFYYISTITIEDLNGDNYMDLIVGSNSEVVIFYGGPDKQAFGNSSYIITVSEIRANINVAAAGDYDKDGIHDIIAEIPAENKTLVVFGFSAALGIPEKSPQTVTQIEYIKARGNIGDINSDGYDDIIYQLEKNLNDPQEVIIALGPDYDIENPDWSVQGTDPGSSYLFGYACGSAGDINGDGYTDIVIGDGVYNPTPENTTHLGNWGKVYIWFGGPVSASNPTGFGENPTLADADFTISGSVIAGSFGSSVASGDINGDQFSDIAVGDPRAASYCFDDETGYQNLVETGSVTTYLSGLGPPDSDNDGYYNTIDNCPNTYNPGQENEDGDKHGDVCDNCQSVKNDLQEDSDNDGTGDACDVCTRDAKNDIDGDGYCEGTGYLEPKIGDNDNCPDISNADQTDTDTDGIGNVCDDDDDGDNIPDATDNCPLASNTSQSDMNSNGIGDACDDMDKDGTVDATDNCPYLANADQADLDEDGIGDLCDNCPEASNHSQSDSDNDELGDACDTDDDNDGIPDVTDNCRTSYNPDQEDTDGDGIGDSCNADIDRDNDDWADNIDNCPDRPNKDQTDANNNGIGDSCEIDLTISRIEITQAIQDDNNSIFLISGKTTYLRVYFDVGQAQQEIGPISGMIKFYYQNGLPMYTFINGLATQKTLSSNNTIVALPKAEMRRGDPNHTLNFTIPGSWGWDDVPYLRLFIFNNSSIEETNPYNNYIQDFPLKFKHADVLNLVFVPIKVTADGSNCTPTLEQFYSCLNYVRHVYPVRKINLWKSETRTFDKDPSCHGDDLIFNIWRLNLMTDDPVDNLKYHGLVCEKGQIPQSCNIGGKGGYAFFNDDESWSYYESPPRAGINIAHELGHNFGRDHTPSFQAEPEDIDENFPSLTVTECYADGSYMLEQDNPLQHYTLRF